MLCNTVSEAKQTPLYWNLQIDNPNLGKLWWMEFHFENRTWCLISHEWIFIMRNDQRGLPLWLTIWNQGFKKINTVDISVLMDRACLLFMDWLCSLLMNWARWARFSYETTVEMTENWKRPLKTYSTTWDRMNMRKAQERYYKCFAIL